MSSYRKFINLFGEKVERADKDDSERFRKRGMCAQFEEYCYGGRLFSTKQEKLSKILTKDKATRQIRNVSKRGKLIEQLIDIINIYCYYNHN